MSRIAGTLFKMAIKVWAYTSLVVFFCFLVYYMYGGIFAFALFIISALGKKHKNTTSWKQRLFFISQAFCITHKTISCSTQSCPAILECTFQILPCSTCLMKAFRFARLTKRLYTCILYTNPGKDRGILLQLYSSTATLEIWATGCKIVLDCITICIAICFWWNTEDMGFLRVVRQKKGCIWMQEQVWITYSPGMT